jgi:hypothetical protein
MKKKQKFVLEDVLIYVRHLDPDLANQMNRSMDPLQIRIRNPGYLCTVGYLSNRSRREGGVAKDKVGQVGLTVGVRLVGHGRPGQVHHVQRHKARLQQSRVRLVLLMIQCFFLNFKSW